MIIAGLSIVFGLILLVWSADKFIEGSIAAAKLAGVSPLIIGMVIVGFGTSAPEMAVSALSAVEGNAGLALGNAYGSNIANIGLILGLTAVLSPIAVSSQVLRKELPILTAITGLTLVLLWDLRISRIDACVLIVVFAGLMIWTIRQDRRKTADSLSAEIDQELSERRMSKRQSIFWIVAGITLLVGSSRLLVWGAVEFAKVLGVSDLIIGLTVVAVGTSLPELASSIMAAIKKEHDIALGNVLGSNLFNTLAVVGLAGIIKPFDVEPAVISRDFPVMALFTVSIFVLGFGFRGPGRINRIEGGLLMIGYTAYIIFLVVST